MSIKDIYRHTTIIGLAGALAAAGRTPVGAPGPARTGPHDPRRNRRSRTPAQAPMSRSRPHYHLCGLLQLLLFLALLRCSACSSWSTGFVVDLGQPDPARHLPAVVDVHQRAPSPRTCLLSILAKWILIGRWKPRQIPVWSLDYVRFWLVKSLIRTNPLVRFAGTPLYSLYLRALGAKIGRGVAIFSPTVPVVHRPAHHRIGHRHPQGLVLTGYRAVDG